MTLVDVNTSTEPSTNQPRSISRFTGCVHVNAFTGRVLQGWRPVFHTDGSEGMVAFDKHGLRISCDNVPTTMTETEMGTNLILALKKYGSIEYFSMCLFVLNREGKYERVYGSLFERDTAFPQPPTCVKLVAYVSFTRPQHARRCMNIPLDERRVFHPLKTRDAGGKVMLVKPHFLTSWLFLLPRRGWVLLPDTPGVLHRYRKKGLKVHGTESATIKAWNVARRGATASLDTTLPEANRPEVFSLDTVPEDSWVAFKGVREVPRQMPGQGYTYPVDYQSVSPRMPTADRQRQATLPTLPSPAVDVPPKADITYLPDGSGMELPEAMMIDLPLFDDVPFDPVFNRKRGLEGESSGRRSEGPNDHKPALKRARLA